MLKVHYISENFLTFTHDVVTFIWKGCIIYFTKQQIQSSKTWARILVHVTIYGRLLIGRDGRLDQSDISAIYRNLYENTDSGDYNVILKVIDLSDWN